MSDSSDPMDCSLPGSSVHGIFQARVLEWGAISFSNTGILFNHKKNEIVPLAATWMDLGIITGEGNGTPLQYFCLENPVDGGAWKAAVHGVARVGHD